MRRLATLTLLATVAVLTAVSMSGQATAGGPTSVLITNVNGERAAALYYTDDRYPMLEELLHGGNTATGAAAEPNGIGTSFNITWLIHDVSIWRTDHLVLDSRGDPWIQTQMSNGSGVLESGARWVPLNNGAAIVDLLDAIGIVGEVQPAATVDSVTAAAEPTADSSVQSGTSAWRWVVPGLVLGLLAGWLIARWQTRQTRSMFEPRQVTVG